jgi:hypothetical protein
MFFVEDQIGHDACGYRPIRNRMRRFFEWSNNRSPTDHAIGGGSNDHYGGARHNRGIGHH